MSFCPKAAIESSTSFFVSLQLQIPMVEHFQRKAPDRAASRSFSTVSWGRVLFFEDSYASSFCNSYLKGPYSFLQLNIRLIVIKEFL